MQVTFDDVVSITLPEGLRSELVRAAQSRGEVLAEFVRCALKAAVIEAISPESDGDSLPN